VWLIDEGEIHALVLLVLKAISAKSIDLRRLSTTANVGQYSYGCPVTLTMSRKRFPAYATIRPGGSPRIAGW